MNRDFKLMCFYCPVYVPCVYSIHVPCSCEFVVYSMWEKPRLHLGGSFIDTGPLSTPRSLTPPVKKFITKLPGYCEPGSFEDSSGTEFFVISIKQILKQIMATPSLSEIIARYPQQHTDRLMREIFQGQQWLQTAQFCTPMVEVGSNQYFVQSNGSLEVKPPFVCYICGREFGSKSISIHEPKCLEKWQIENNQLPRQQRRPIPIKPGSMSQSDGINNIPDYNEAACQSANAQLLPCNNCGRTFAPDRLPIHQRSCRPKTATLSEPSVKVDRTPLTPKNTQPKVPAKPKTLICYICGREFGSKSLEIHEPQCLKKWNIQNKQLPKELRRPTPKRPESLMGGGRSSGKFNKAEMNEAAWEAHKSNLVPCPNCGRTFAPDRIQVHQRGCGPNKTRECLQNQHHLDRKEKSTKSPAVVRRPATVICYLCGREYGSKSITIHEPNCLKKWHMENDKLPKGQRRNAPVKPEIRHIGGGSGGQHTIEEINNAAFQAANANLVPCQKCGRTFLPDSLVIHERSCKKSTSAKQR
ncbi:zinc finger protein 474-like [Amphiura filiformis]|uniref:zinc finger protein 474-like n=1 Tax=Amphiura filiformis TaxID=82378 RepID=UPI003B21388F